MIYTIYKYTNIYNSKVYVGQTTKSLEERACSNGSNYKPCSRFYAAIQEYSWDAFVPTVLAVVQTEAEADELEQYYIDLYNSRDPQYGYNLSVGGRTAGLVDAQEETRLKISTQAKARYKDKTKNPMYGKHHSEDTLRKQSECKLGERNPMYGRHWTERQRELCGTKGKHLNLSEERRAQISELGKRTGKLGTKPVVCETDGMTFSSMKEACEFYNIPKGTLCGHLKGRTKTCRGLVFKYLT